MSLHDGWPALWRPRWRRPDPVADVDAWTAASTARWNAAMDRSVPTWHTSPSGPMWLASAARRDDGDEPLPWLDGGLPSAARDEAP